MLPICRGAYHRTEKEKTGEVPFPLLGVKMVLYFYPFQKNLPLEDAVGKIILCFCRAESPKEGGQKA